MTFFEPSEIKELRALEAAASPRPWGKADATLIVAMRNNFSDLLDALEVAYAMLRQEAAKSHPAKPLAVDLSDLQKKAEAVDLDELEKFANDALISWPKANLFTIILALIAETRALRAVKPAVDVPLMLQERDRAHDEIRRLNAELAETRAAKLPPVGVVTTEEQPQCSCRSAPMGSTSCKSCKHDLGCPVHNAAPCRRPDGYANSPTGTAAVAGPGRSRRREFDRDASVDPGVVTREQLFEGFPASYWAAQCKEARIELLEERLAAMSRGAAAEDAALVLENPDASMAERNDLAHELRVLCAASEPPAGVEVGDALAALDAMMRKGLALDDQFHGTQFRTYADTIRSALERGAREVSTAKRDALLELHDMMRAGPGQRTALAALYNLSFKYGAMREINGIATIGAFEPEAQ